MSNEPEENPQGEEEVIASLEESLGEEDSQLAATVSELEQVKDDLARSRADLYNLNQEYSNYVRRAKADASTQREVGQCEVLSALLSVLDDVEAAREAGELGDGPFAAIASKIEDTLQNRFGLERYGAVGDDFDPQLHEALMAQTNPEVQHPQVKQVLQSGYRVKDRVIRATKVMVDNPE